MSAPKRGPNGKRRYSMDFISDKRLYVAVMFARKMIRSGQTPGEANAIAARHYGFRVADVAHYTGQAAGTTSGRKRS